VAEGGKISVEGGAAFARLLGEAQNSQNTWHCQKANQTVQFCFEQSVCVSLHEGLTSEKISIIIYLLYSLKGVKMI